MVLLQSLDVDPHSRRSPTQIVGAAAAFRLRGDESNWMWEIRANHDERRVIIVS